MLSDPRSHVDQSPTGGKFGGGLLESYSKQVEYCGRESLPFCVVPSYYLAWNGLSFTPRTLSRIQNRS